MCEPMTIAALGAMAVGTGLQIKANRDRKQDMRKLQRRETERTEGLHKEAMKNVVQNRESYERANVEQKMQDASGERQAQYAKAEAAAPRANEMPVGAVSGNQVINDAFARAMSGAKADATQSGALRAELASFGDTLGEASRENNRRTGEIGMIGSFQQGNSRILPLELQHAATKQRSAETWGKVLQAFGGAMMGGVGTAAGAAAAPAATGGGGGIDFSSLFSSGRSPNLG